MFSTSATFSSFLSFFSPFFLPSFPFFLSPLCYFLLHFLFSFKFMLTSIISIMLQNTDICNFFCLVFVVVVLQFSYKPFFPHNQLTQFSQKKKFICSNLPLLLLLVFAILLPYSHPPHKGISGPKLFALIIFSLSFPLSCLLNYTYTAH